MRSVEFDEYERTNLTFHLQLIKHPSASSQRAQRHFDDALWDLLMLRPHIYGGGGSSDTKNKNMYMPILISQFIPPPFLSCFLYLWLNSCSVNSFVQFF